VAGDQDSPRRGAVASCKVIGHFNRFIRQFKLARGRFKQPFIYLFSFEPQGKHASRRDS
jgi:hypothetical protein